MVSPLREFTRVDDEYGLRAGTAMALFRGGSRFGECETGKTSFAEFSARAVAEVEAEQGIRVPPERLAKMMAAIMGGAVERSMYNLVLELKAAGLQIGILSNVYRELDGWLRGAFPLGTVDVFAPSYELGLRKPDPAIYRRLVEMCNLRPQEIVFIDDFPENVEAAVAAGLYGILFAGENALRKELRALGLPA